MAIVGKLRGRRATGFVGHGAVRTRCHWLLLSSAAGVALATLPAAAQAACSPDPTVANGTTICTGLDSDGIAVPTNQTTVRIAADAIVSGSTTRPVTASGADTRLIVEGRIEGRNMTTAGAAVLLSGQRPRIDVGTSGSVLGGDGSIRYAPTASGTLTIDNSGLIQASRAAIQLQSNPSAALDLTNRSGAVVRGAVAIEAILPTGFTFTTAGITRLDNAGTIQGTGGRAIDLSSTNNQRGSIGTLTNRATGRIEGELVIGQLGQLTNAGLLDGGTRSVINLTTQSFGTWNNSGTITSRRADAGTLSVGSLTLTNSGTVSNTGGGAAIAPAGFINLTNLAGGIISSTGSTAIQGTGGSLLDNSGRIVGDVDFSGAVGNDRLTQRGIIQGSVRLGGGDDSFFLDLAAGLTGTGVTGAIDAGSGNDTFGLTTTGVHSVALGALPATFERYILEAAATDAVLTATGAIGTAPLTTQGVGTVISALDLTRSGEVAIQANAGTTINRGTIDFTGAGPGTGRQAVFGSSNTRTINEGSIIARGARSLVVFSGNNFENRGAIRLLDAAGLSSTGPVINSGTIEISAAASQLFTRDGGGLGTVTLDNRGLISSVGSIFTSDANIVGATITNSGTLRAAGRAIDVSVRNANSTVTIDNRLGGTIEGSGFAILGSAGSESVTNAGRIVGNVDLGAGNDTYVSAGRLEGNLALGDGNDIYMIDVGVPGVVTGSIDAGAGTDIRRLLARSDAVVEASPDARFEITDLVVNGATSSLGTRPVVTNRTSLSAIGGATAVSVSGNTAFTNAATLSANGAGSAAMRTGVLSSGSPTVFNDGVITVDNGAIGVGMTAGLLVNRATIAGAGRGVTINAGRFDNASRILTTDAAVQIAGGLARVNNRGLLQSSAGAAVINGAASTTFRNLEGGVVSGGAGVAYQGATSGETVYNAGRFVGDVSLGLGNDIYQYAGGTIEGRLLLGAGNDRVDVGLNGLNVTFATGGVDAGDGIDTYAFSVDSSRAIDLAAVAGFEGLALTTVGTGTEVTINAAPAGAAPLDVLLEIGGDGSVVNNRALSRSGSSVVQTTGSGLFTNRATIDVASTAQSGTVFGLRGTDASPTGLTLVNAGNIRAIGASAIAVVTPAFISANNVTMINSGGIAANGGAIGLAVASGTVRNTGAIGADAPSTAATISGSGRLLNEGTITAGNLGVSIDASASQAALLNNSGSVSATGAAVAVATSGRVVNSGRLTSTNGAAVQLASQQFFGNVAVVLNNSGGVIAGSSDAITAAQSANGRIANRGAITGNVNFATGTNQSLGTGDVFFADGGRVTGNVRFGGSSDIFIVSLAQAATPGASISGTLDMGGGGDTLRLRADTSAAATVLTTAAGFDRVTYEAAGRGTVLTLTSPTTLGFLELTGDGTVDLSTDLQTSSNALTVASNSTEQLFIDTSLPAPTTTTGLRVISRGTITATATQQGGATSVVSLGGSERFENAGTIRLTQGADQNISRAAISGTGSIINSGRIELAGGNFGIVSNSGDIINRGTIEQVSGTSATGVAGARSFDNSGVLRVGGTAIDGNQTRVINSGTIESVSGAAIGGAAFIVNSAGGRIVAGPGSGAIALSGANDGLINAGIVAGNVDLGAGNDLFIAAGGEIAGSVTLGTGEDTYLIRGGAAAPTGGVSNAGGGRDAFGRSFTASASYALEKPADYDMYAVEAAGAGTTVTLTSPNSVGGGLRVFGTGTVDSRANIALADDVAANAAIELYRTNETTSDPTLRFVNRGTVTSTGVGVRTLNDGTVSSGFALFENIGSIESRFVTAELGATSRTGGVSIANSGTLRSLEGAAALRLSLTLRSADVGAAALPSVEVVNTGAIVNANSLGTSSGNGADLFAEGAALRIANSGSIDTAGLSGAALQATAAQLTLANSGRIAASGRGADALFVSIERPEATGGTPVAVPTSTITNDGIIRATGAAAYGGLSTTSGELVSAATAVTLITPAALELRNNAAGVIEATGDRSAAILGGSFDSSSPAALTINNAGTIRGAGTTLADHEGFLLSLGLGTDRVLAGAIHTVASIDSVSNATTGRIIGSINLGAGNDSLENFGRIEGGILLGSGDDRLVQALSGTLVGSADGGTGIDSLIFDITGGGTIDFRQFANFEAISQRGRGTVIFAGLDGGPLPIETFDLADTSFTLAAGQTFATRGATALTGTAGAESVSNAGTISGSVSLGGGNDTVINTGTISGSLDLGAGDDSVTNNGRVVGSVLLGAGNDRYTTNGVATVGGTVDGGDGTDTIEFAVTGTAAAPAVWNGTGTTGFETLLLSQGTLSLSGTTPAFTTANISGGYLVGQAGSVLTAQTVNVAQGATFGTSGRVVGNVNVAGTLSPGSSPGTMTVTGNVALASGSTTLFEITPTVSDLLLVSGTTSIATGATLNLTGTRAASTTPLDLIVSDGGITGSFTTVNKAATIVGFVAQRGNRLQLLGQFATDTAFGAPARAAIDYVNAAILAGQLSPALSAALPSLLTAQGGAAADRFGELTPEAYATASTYGVSRALLLADTLRSAAVGQGDRAGTFAFASGVADWTDADGGPASEAEFETRGVIGGVGHRFESGSSVAAFIGTLDGEARTGALRARTDADSIAFGVHGQLVSGGLAVDTTLSYETGKGKLSRAVTADASSPRSRFDLNGLVADLSASYRTDMGGAWTLAPRVGLTYVSVDRDDATETGGAFALTAPGDRNNLLFGNLGVEARGSLDGFQPFVALGVRPRLDGSEAVAAGQFAGVTVAPLRAAGAEIGRTVFSAGAGASAALSAKVRLTGGYEAAFGDRESHAVTVGLNAAF